MSVPDALPNAQRAAPEMVNFEGERFPDSKTCGSQQCIKHAELPIGPRDNLLDFFRGEGWSSLAGHGGQINELVIPFAGVKFLAVIPDGRRHHHLYDLNIIPDRLWRETHLRHLRNQALDDEVIDVGERRIAQS
jgi:hypothetical protein